MKKVAALVILVALGAVSACAHGPAPVRDRQVSQQRRITQGVRTGELTPREASRLQRQELRLHREIVRDRADGGGLSLQERRKIDRQQDRMSDRIRREKHDRQSVR